MSTELKNHFSMNVDLITTSRSESHFLAMCPLRIMIGTPEFLNRNIKFLKFLKNCCQVLFIENIGSENVQGNQGCGSILI